MGTPVKSHNKHKNSAKIPSPSSLIKGDKFKIDSTPFMIGSKDGAILSEPEIKVKKEKDFVSAIEIKCVCGRAIHIDCK